MYKKGEAITALVIIGLLAFGAFTLLTVSSNSPTGLAGFETAIAACGSVATSDNLTSNVIYSGTAACIQITGNNVVFDCQGFTIFYSNAVSDVAAISAYNVQNVTIKNCITQQTTPSGVNAPGINLTNVNNSIIINNTLNFNTTGFSNPYLIRITGSINNTFYNNTFSSPSTTSTTSGGFDLGSGTNYTNISSNVFNTNGFGVTQVVGIITGEISTTGTTIDNNTFNAIGTSTPNGIHMNIGNNTVITNNVMRLYGTGSSTGRNAIGFSFGGDNATVRGNTINITSGGGSLVGIRFFRPGNNSVVSSNTVLVNSSTFSARALSFLLTGPATNYTIINNSFSILNVTFSGAIIGNDYIVSNSVIANNTLTQRSTTSTLVAIGSTTWNNLTIYNNTINNVSQGVSIPSGTNITANQNNIILTGSQPAISISASNSNVTNNTILSSGFGTGISLGGTNGTIYNNSIVATGFGTGGVSTSGTNQTVFDNYMTNSTLSPSGTQGHFYNNTLINGQIVAGGSSDNIHDNPMIFDTTTDSFIYAIQVSSSDSNISNESVSYSTSGTDNRGIYMSGSTNRLSNINLTVNGAEPMYGINVVSGAANNLFDNIIINTNGSTAIQVVDTSGNNFSNILLNNTSSWIDSQDTGAGADNNFTNITFVNTGIGQSYFYFFNMNGNSNATRTTLNMSNNKIFLNTTVLPGMNQTATISWFNVTTNNIEVDFEDDGTFIPCGAVCNISSFLAPNLVFNVSHFTTFQSGGAGGINLSITKTDDPDPVAAGAQLNYTITINVTSGTAVNVTVNETYPGSVTFDSSSPAPSSGDNIFSLGDLTGPVVSQINITVNVSSAASGTLVNSINVTYQNSTGDNLSAIVTESTTVTSTPSGGGGGGGGSGGSGGYICPPLCQYPENANLPVCKNNCFAQTEIAPPTTQSPLNFPSSSDNIDSASKSIESAPSVPVEEETIEVVEEPLPSSTERTGLAKFFPWLILLVLAALIIAILSHSRKNGSKSAPIAIKTSVTNQITKIHDKETKEILENIRKSEERLKRLLGK